MVKKFSFAALLLISAVSCYEGVSQMQPEQQIVAGLIEINSIPSGAGIFVNGRLSGYATPAKIPGLSEGDYEFLLRREFYKDTLLRVYLNKKDTLRLNIEYNKNPRMLGSISLKSNPSDAIISLDDSLLGKKTPVIVSGIIPGVHKVSYEKTGYWKTSKLIKVYSGLTANGEFALDDTTTWVTYTTLNSDIPTDDITCIGIDNNNHVWAGTTDKGLIWYDWKVWHIFNKENSFLPGNHVPCIKVNTDGKIWVGTDAGLAIIDNGLWEIFNSANTGMPLDYVSTLDVSQSGNVLIGTKEGLVRLYYGRWILLGPNNSDVPNDWVSKVRFYSGDNQFWVSCVKYSLLQFDSRKWWRWGMRNTWNHSISSRGSPPNIWKTITSIDTDKQGNSFFGASYNETIYLFRNKSQSWAFELELGDNAIFDLFCDDQEYIWLSTRNGLIRYHLTKRPTIAFSPKNSGLKSYIISAVDQGSNSILWVGTSGGGITKYKAYQ